MKKLAKYLVCVLVGSISISCSEISGLKSEGDFIESQVSSHFNSAYLSTGITVGTFNILSSEHDDVHPNNTWASRKTAVRDIIIQQNNDPDVFGIQEGQVTTDIDTLASLLGSGYDSYVSTQEISPRAIFWKSNDFTLLASNTLDLLPGETGYSKNRYATYVRLEHNATGKILLFFNVHLPWGTTTAIREARRDAAETLTGKVRRYSAEYFDYAPAIVVGDFNHYPDTEQGGITTASAILIKNGLKDAFEYTTNWTNEDYNTTNNIEEAKAWAGPDGSKRLDYIFTFPGSVTINSWSNVINFDGSSTVDLETPVPSDHNPVQASINLPNRMTDIDGNEYNTIVIGEQEWMAENLKVTHYRNGASISGGLSNSTWTSTSSGAYAIYPHSGVSGIDSDAEMIAYYGRLYNWYAVNDSRGLCPSGWREPTDVDWKDLEEYLGMSQQDADNIGWRPSGSVGLDIKSSGGWYNDDGIGGGNESGYTALPSGYRSANNGNFSRITTYNYLWSATEYSGSNAYRRVLKYEYNSIHRTNIDKKEGSSLRCLKN